RHTPLSLTAAAVKQLRPKQWAKNVFLLAALLFSRRFFDPDALLHVAMGVAAFCLVSSSGYVLNDLLDREADRLHPKKRHRPIASGALPVPMAVVLLLVVGAVGLSLAMAVSPTFLVVTLCYLVTTLSYSWFFKHIVILDVMFLASGFVW